MKPDGRLSASLHALLHMREEAKPMTSEQLAECMRTHSVVVRRTMAGLRKAGFVRSEKGHGGGWSIACDFEVVTLRDIYAALGEPVVLAMGNRTDKPKCLVEQAVNNVLSEAFRDAQALLIDRLGSISLAKLSADLHARMQVRRRAARTAHAV